MDDRPIIKPLKVVADAAASGGSDKEARKEVVVERPTLEEKAWRNMGLKGKAGQLFVIILL